jgi:hypothetical protein
MGRNMMKYSSPDAPSTLLVFLCLRTHAQSSESLTFIRTREKVQWNLGSRTPRSRTNFSSQKSRMTNCVSDYEHASWQQRLATSIEYRRGSVSCWLTLAQYTSLLEFAVPSLEFHCVLCFLNILLNKTPWDQRRIMNKESLAARACTILRTGLLTCETWTLQLTHIK